MSHVPPSDPRWKLAATSLEMEQFAADVTAASAAIKKLLERASALRGNIEQQMGAEFTGMAKLTRPMKLLEDASEKTDQAAWGLQDFAEKFKRVSL